MVVMFPLPAALPLTATLGAGFTFCCFSVALFDAPEVGTPLGGPVGVGLECDDEEEDEEEKRSFGVSPFKARICFSSSWSLVSLLLIDSNLRTESVSVISLPSSLSSPSPSLFFTLLRSNFSAFTPLPEKIRVKSVGSERVQKRQARAYLAISNRKKRNG